MTQPYYEQDGIVIYHGDALEILPGLKADAVVTDPPYGIGEARGKNRTRSNATVATDYGSAAWDDHPPSPETLALVLAAAPAAIIFGGNYFALPPASKWLVWDKDNGANDFADCELAWTNLPGAVRRLRHRWAGMLQEPGAEREHRQHPTQKPLPVMRWCLTFCPPGTVLDPFMGSGTTLVAAKLEGRKATGIDLSERYCEIAAKRLAQGVLPFA